MCFFTFRLSQSVIYGTVSLETFVMKKRVTVAYKSHTVRDFQLKWNVTEVVSFLWFLRSLSEALFSSH